MHAPRRFRCRCHCQEAPRRGKLLSMQSMKAATVPSRGLEGDRAPRPDRARDPRTASGQHSEDCARQPAASSCGQPGRHAGRAGGIRKDDSAGAVGRARGPVLRLGRLRGGGRPASAVRSHRVGVGRTGSLERSVAASIRARRSPAPALRKLRAAFASLVVRSSWRSTASTSSPRAPAPTSWPRSRSTSPRDRPSPWRGDRYRADRSPGCGRAAASTRS